MKIDAGAAAHQAIELDDLDKGIVEILRSNGRATNQEIAEKLSFRFADDSVTITDDLNRALTFATTGTKQGHRRQVEPDWAVVHRELKRKHVTLSILWDEYIERHPEGYRYSRFCELYRSWEGKLSVTMRQTHLGGDKLFVGL